MRETCSPQKTAGLPAEVTDTSMPDSLRAIVLTVADSLKKMKTLQNLRPVLKNIELRHSSFSY
jgi:hypothetical protein